MNIAVQKLQFVCDPETISPKDDGGAAERVYANLAKLDLEKNAWEMDVNGYTVLSPSQIGPPAFTAKVRECILREAEAATGIAPDMDTGSSHRDFITPLGRAQYLPNMLFSDSVFEQVAMSPSVLGIVTYLLGESCAMTAMNAVIKGPGPEYLPLHVDTPQPAPLPAYAQVCNVTWILSDFNAENGTTLFVPGSHKLCRNPVGDESTDLTATVPLEAPAGSVVIWHGNTWHGALPRTAPGLRISLVTFFSRYYVSPPSRDHYSDRITQDMLDRNPERFARLTGKKPLSIPAEYYCRNSQFA